jgi:uncharacterized protein
MLWAALLMGLAGGFHCAGMCGPIMIALSSGSSSFRFRYGKVFYHAGRISIYMLLGVLAGFAGKALDIGGLQSKVAIISGLLMIVLVLLIYLKPFGISSLMNKYTTALRLLFQRLNKTRNKLTLFFFGATNGLLPCGLVYMAMAGALAAGSISESALYMLIFGLGTLPVLLSLSFLGVKTVRAGRFANKLAPYLVVALGILMIWRGLHIDAASCCSH